MIRVWVVLAVVAIASLWASASDRRDHDRAVDFDTQEYRRAVIDRW